MTDATIDADRALIDELGGPTSVARQLGYAPARGGAQRVDNWRRRGIPAHVKVARPDLFMRHLKASVTADAPTVPPTPPVGIPQAGETLIHPASAVSSEGASHG